MAGISPSGRPHRPRGSAPPRDPRASPLQLQRDSVVPAADPFATRLVRTQAPCPAPWARPSCRNCRNPKRICYPKRIRGPIGERVPPTRPVALDATYRIAPRWLRRLEAGDIAKRHRIGQQLVEALGAGDADRRGEGDGQTVHRPIALERLGARERHGGGRMFPGHRCRTRASIVSEGIVSIVRFIRRANSWTKCRTST